MTFRCDEAAEKTKYIGCFGLYLVVFSWGFLEKSNSQPKKKEIWFHFFTRFTTLKTLIGYKIGSGMSLHKTFIFLYTYTQRSTKTN